MTETSGPTFRHGLSFLAALAFVASFFGSRAFATLNPQIVLVQQGIHFHHFWYGIGLLASAGWLGISRRSDRLDRVYAIVYGLGAGFIGDEVGLLLTFGNYDSELTYIFFVGAVSFIIIVTLLVRYKDRLEKDVLSLGAGERLSHFGIFLAGFSALFFAFGLTPYGVAMAGVGVTLAVAGRLHERGSLKFNG